MTLPSSGPLSMSQIAAEFGGTAPHSLSEYYGAAPGVPASGTIKYSDFYGKSSGILTSNITNTGYQDLADTSKISHADLDLNGNSDPIPSATTTTVDISDPITFSNDSDPSTFVDRNQAMWLTDGLKNSFSPKGGSGALTYNFSPALTGDTSLKLYLNVGGSQGACAASYFSLNNTNVQPTCCANGMPSGWQWLDIWNGQYIGSNVRSLSKIEGNAIAVNGGMNVIAGIAINNVIIVGNYLTTLTFADTTNFSQFPPGTQVKQANDASKTGVVLRNLSGSRQLVISSYQNTWTNGQQVATA